MICLMGNHEDMMLAALGAEEWEETWLRNGGIQTLRGYGVTAAKDLPRRSRRLDSQTPPNSHDDGLRFLSMPGLIQIGRSTNRMSTICSGSESRCFHLKRTSAGLSSMVTRH
jgi:hypothetical protein